MLTLAWRNVRFNLVRYVATLVAIATGVAFFAASGFLADRVILALEGDVDRQFGAVDAAVVVATPDGQTSGVAYAEGLRIGGAVADQMARLPEVEVVAGELTGAVALLRDDGTVGAEGATGRLWVADDALNAADIVDGRAPGQAGEVAVDRGLAASEGLAPGDRVTVLTQAGPFPATVTGITAFGEADAADADGTISIPEATAFEWLNRGQVEFTSLLVRGRVDPEELRARLAPLAPAGFQVVTGDTFREERRAQVGAIGGTLKSALQFFALLALLVGGFVIYNTFNVIVAQRTRELAMLAAIGATPRQLKRSLRWEGLVIGLTGSSIGVLAGFGLAFGLVAVLGRLGVALPGSGLRVGSGTVVASLLFGTVITLVSVLAPARRAGRTEPIEALRQADSPTLAVSRTRVVVAVVLVVGGALAMAFGPNGGLVVLGVVAAFAGVLVSGPVIAVAGSALLRPLLRPFGLEGRLAADNTARNPHRTATTSNALLIGVFLVTFVSVAGTSAKDFAVDQINKLSTADFTLESQGGTIDEALVGDLSAVDGVESVTPFRREAVSLAVGGTNRGATTLSTGDLDRLRTAAGIDLASGSFDDLRPGTVLLLETDTFGTGAGVGSTARFTNSQGESVDLEVVGVIATSLDSFLTGSITDVATFDGFVGATAPTVAFISAESGRQSDAKDGIEAITARRPDITLQEGNLVGRLVGFVFDFVINAVNGLLMMSVVIALIGIVNTLTLSILERRRELGLLRVVGMVDRRVRRMVRLESVVIATLGTTSGLVLGVGAGAAMVAALGRSAEAGIAISLPVGMLAAILVLGIVLGVLASIIPAQRSTHLDVLDAIAAA